MRGRHASAIVRPVLDDVIEAHGGNRTDWERVFDQAARPDDEAVLRACESMARRDALSGALGVEHISIMRGRRGPLSRRFGRRPGTPSLAQLFRGLFVDGGTAATRDVWTDASNVEPSAGKASCLFDYIDQTHCLEQLTGSNQAALPTADAAMAGALTLSFVSTSSIRYDSTRVPASWRWWQNGTGCEVFLSYVPTATTTAYLLSTRAGSVVAENGGLLCSLSPNTVRASFTNGASALIDSGNVGATAVGTGTYMNFSYVEGASPEWTLRLKTSLIASGTTGAVAPSSGDPQGTLRLGAGVSGAAPANMRWRAAYAFRRVLSTADRAVVRTWIQQDTGLV